MFLSFWQHVHAHLTMELSATKKKKKKKKEKRLSLHVLLLFSLLHFSQCDCLSYFFQCLMMKDQYWAKTSLNIIAKRVLPWSNPKFWRKKRGKERNAALPFGHDRMFAQCLWKNWRLLFIVISIVSVSFELKARSVSEHRSSAMMSSDESIWSIDWKQD